MFYFFRRSPITFNLILLYFTQNKTLNDIISKHKTLQNYFLIKNLFVQKHFPEYYVPNRK